MPTDWAYDAICPVWNNNKLKIQLKRPHTKFEVKVIQFWVSKYSFSNDFLVSLVQWNDTTQKLALK